MKIIYLSLASILFTGCATPYKGPQSGDIATVHFQLEKGLEDGPTVSMFEGLECKPSEYGEHIGDLWAGNLTEPSTLEFTVNVPANRLLAFEFFHHHTFTGETVMSGQFCRQTLAFTPEKNGRYEFTYGKCEYKGIDLSKNKEIETTQPTGKCHSSKYIGAY